MSNNRGSPKTLDISHIKPLHKNSVISDWRPFSVRSFHLKEHHYLISQSNTCFNTKPSILVRVHLDWSLNGCLAHGSYCSQPESRRVRVTSWLWWEGSFPACCPPQSSVYRLKDHNHTSSKYTARRCQSQLISLDLVFNFVHVHYNYYICLYNKELQRTDVWVTGTSGKKIICRHVTEISLKWQFGPCEWAVHQTPVSLNRQIFGGRFWFHEEEENMFPLCHFNVTDSLFSYIQKYDTCHASAGANIRGPNSLLTEPTKNIFKRHHMDTDAIHRHD